MTEQNERTINGVLRKSGALRQTISLKAPPVAASLADLHNRSMHANRRLASGAKT